LWHISRDSILLWWHISRSSSLTILLGWHKTRLRCTILSMWHIWVWIHSTWLSVCRIGSHHIRLRCTILSLWHIWVWIYSTRLSVYWLWRHHSRLNKRLSLRHIVLIHSCLSKVLRIVEVLWCIVVWIILGLRSLVMEIFYCFNFFLINVPRVLRSAIIWENHSTDAEANAAENN
jgi:hypothetical protein